MTDKNVYERRDLFGSETIDESNPKHLRLLGLMTEWGLSVGILMPLLDLAGVKLTTDQRRFLMGPIIVHSGGGWNDIIPSWLYDLARAERFEMVVEKKPGIVGPCELTAVMYGAMLEAPRTHEITELYLWASVNACVRHYKHDRNELWKNLNHAPIRDRDVILHNGRLWQTYQALATDVVRKVIEEQTERERHEERQEARMATYEAQRQRNREAQAKAQEEADRRKQEASAQMRML